MPTTIEAGLSDIIKAVGTMQIAYRKDFTEEQMDLYIQRLAMLDPVVVKVAILNLIDTRKFLPSVAEIKAECRKVSAAVQCIEYISADEAWSMALQAAGSYGYEKGLETLPDNVKTVAKRFWQEICYDNVGNIPLMRAHFMRAYAAEEDRREEATRIGAAISASPALAKARSNAVSLQKKVLELVEAKTMK